MLYFIVPIKFKLLLDIQHLWNKFNLLCLVATNQVEIYASHMDLDLDWYGQIEGGCILIDLDVIDILITKCKLLISNNLKELKLNK